MLKNIMRMKRIFILSALAIMAFAACKKKTTQVSTLVTVSYPKVTISSPQFFSIPVGGVLPDANAIVATAYDSFYQQPISVVVDASKVSSLTPGLYTITVSAKNQYGYIGYSDVYVAVTDVSDTVNISGLYFANVGAGADSLRPARVTKVARGLYQTTNLGGIDTSGQPSAVVPAYFVMVNDTAISLGMQVIPNTNTTAANFITGTSGSLNLVTIPNSYTYSFSDMLGMFGTVTRTFVKQ
jgi:hypothetical protein